MSIQFFTEETDFRFSQRDKVTRWLSRISTDHLHQIEKLNYIFCSDDYLLRINRDYLNHDNYTDIISFDNSDKKGQIEGDIFISIDRVIDNSKKYGSLWEEELHRVMVHGLLHLLGYRDKAESKKAQMKEAEDRCLSLLKIDVSRET